MLKGMKNIFELGFQHHHDFGDITMNVAIANGKVIGEEVVKGIKPELKSEIERQVSAAIISIKEDPH
jgi:hypothetical protein